MMSLEEKDLWSRIEVFNFDDPNNTFNFSDRLARENGWKKEFALHVIEAYKKFMFLCCISDTGVTPSLAVDQAWHLHLTYTKSYWHDWCRDTLGKDIHHNPTKGGDAESDKFYGYYAHTFELYEDKFGEAPPGYIWPPAHVRFNDTDFVNVNRRMHFIVPRPSGVTILIPVVVLLLIIMNSPLYISAKVILTVLVASAGIGALLRARSTDSPYGRTARVHTTTYSSGCSGCGGSGCSSDSGCSGDSGCSSGCSGCGGGD